MEEVGTSRRSGYVLIKLIKLLFIRIRVVAVKPVLMKVVIDVEFEVFLQIMLEMGGF